MVSKQKSKWKRAQEKSKYIDRWAETMTKHGIGRETKKGNQWRFVNFRGKKGGESAGIIDLVAIRRRHYKYQRYSDKLDIILIQVKGSTKSPIYPKLSETRRLRSAAKSCNAKKAVLVRYTYKKSKEFYYLGQRNKWKKSTIMEIFV